MGDGGNVRLSAQRSSCDDTLKRKLKLDRQKRSKSAEREEGLRTNSRSGRNAIYTAFPRPRGTYQLRLMKNGKGTAGQDARHGGLKKAR